MTDERAAMTETRRFEAYPVPHGTGWIGQPDAGEVELPAALLAAVDRAGGALMRTVYVLTSGDRAAFALGLHRSHTAQEKLTQLAGDSTLYEELLDRAREHAHGTGALVVKAEAHPDDDAAVAAVVSAGFVALRSPAEPGPTPAGWPLTPAGFIHRGGRPAPRELAYYRQTTEITCGPVALLTGLEALGVLPAPTRREELRAWRSSTVAPDTDVFGLALVAQESGARVTVAANSRGPLVLDPGLSGWEAQFREDLHTELVECAMEAIPTDVRRFGIDDVREAVAAGDIVVLLIDELAMHSVACAHWVTVHGMLDDALLIDDPWTDAELGESWVDAHELPIRGADLDAMADWGGYRAMIAVGPGDTRQR